MEFSGSSTQIYFAAAFRHRSRPKR
jgi:hypothetical protein